MKTPNWAPVWGLLLASTDILAQVVVTETISIGTGSCVPAPSTGGLASNGGAGGRPGASGLPGGNGGSGGVGGVTGGNGTSASGVPSENGGNGTGSGTTGNPPSGVKLSVGSNSNSGLYNYSGFYPLPSNGNLLNGAVTARGARFSGFMTLESCAYACQGVPYFALEQGYICQCGTIAPTSTPVNDPPMPIACAGDVTEICGAPGYGIVYRGSPQSSSVLPNTASVPAPTPTGSVTIVNQITTTNSLASTAAGTSNVTGSVAAAPTPSISSPILTTAAAASSSAAAGALSTTAAGQSTSIAPTGASSTVAATLSSSSLPASNMTMPSTIASPTIPAGATGAAEPTLIAVPSCPASGPNSNNTRYVDLFDNTYDIRCGIDVVGSQRTSAHADTFLRCLQYCDLLDGCIGVTYIDTINQYNNNTNCNSYYTFTGYSFVSQQADGAFYSGVNVHGPSHGVVDPSSGQNTDQDLCAPPIANAYGPDVYGSCYQIGCDQTIGHGSGGTLLAPTVVSSLLACSLYCGFYNSCVSVTWTGPFVAGQNTVICFPKSTYNTTVATVQVGTDYAFNGKCPGQ